MKIKTIEQAEKLGLKTWSYPNGDWGYRDLDGYNHLIRDGEELLPEVKKKFIISYPNGDWDYLDTNNEWQIIKSDNIIKELEKKLEQKISKYKIICPKCDGFLMEYGIKTKMCLGCDKEFEYE